MGGFQDPVHANAAAVSSFVAERNAGVAVDQSGGPGSEAPAWQMMSRVPVPGPAPPPEPPPPPKPIVVKSATWEALACALLKRLSGRPPASASEAPPLCSDVTVTLALSPPSNGRVENDPQGPEGAGRGREGSNPERPGVGNESSAEGPSGTEGPSGAGGPSGTAGPSGAGGPSGKGGPSGTAGPSGTEGPSGMGGPSQAVVAAGGKTRVDKLSPGAREPMEVCAADTCRAEGAACGMDVAVPASDAAVSGREGKSRERARVGELLDAVADLDGGKNGALHPRPDSEGGAGPPGKRARVGDPGDAQRIASKPPEAVKRVGPPADPACPMSEQSTSGGGPAGTGSGRPPSAVDDASAAAGQTAVARDCTGDNVGRTANVTGSEVERSGQARAGPGGGGAEGEGLVSPKGKSRGRAKGQADKENVQSQRVTRSLRK